MADSSMENANLVKLSTANSKFGLNLFLMLAQGKGNVVCSPFSISVAMSMLLRGAKANTAAEIKQVLGFEGVELNDEEINGSFDQLLDVLVQSENTYTLAIANAVISQKDFPFLPDYTLDLQKTYRALTMEVDFVRESASAVSQINNWVKENTRGKISRLFDSLNPSTVMILLNAVYFKGTWEHQFKKERTDMGSFYNKGLESEIKEVPLMKLQKHFPYVEKDNYKVLELPYKGDHIAMLLLLPNEKEGLMSLENSLKADFVKTLKEELHKRKVNVTIPKMHVEYSIELQPILRKLGINEVFGSEANLKGLSLSDSLQVSQVLHKAVLDVNEEGCEAAAVTAIRMVGCCAMVEVVPEFRADHPFLFIIYDKRNNLILFMGRVEEL